MAWLLNRMIRPLKALPRRFPLGAGVLPTLLHRVLECQGHYPKLGLGLSLAQTKTPGVMLRSFGANPIFLDHADSQLIRDASSVAFGSRPLDVLTDNAGMSAFLSCSASFT